MAVSICESVNAALRENLSATATNSPTKLKSSACLSNGDENILDSQLNGAAKSILLEKIEYEEVFDYKSTQDQLKSKYIYIISKNTSNNVNQNNSNATTNRSNNNPLNSGMKFADKHKQQHENGIIHNNNGKVLQKSGLPSPKRILFPRENVQLGWKSSTRKWKIGAGMINVGNTCYLNSALQAIFHVPAFANWLISDEQHRNKCQNGDGGCIVCVMAETLIESQKNDGSIKPWKVYSRLRLICRHFVPGRQEDAHEFLRYLIDAMEKSYLQRFKNFKELDQYSKETTPLNQILGGYLRSDVRCISCDHVSTTFQHFEDLIVDIRKANSIEEALDLYFARERLEDMSYTCESCKKKVSATKQFALERPPAVLCIQLKRFIIGSKLNKHVSIRTRLDLTQYSSLKNKKMNQNKETAQSSPSLIYRLVSMVTHLGASQHSGHYTAIGLTESNGYYQFDDSCVRPIGVQNVLNTNAYVILYELESGSGGQTATATTTSQSANKNCTVVNSSGIASTSTDARFTKLNQSSSKLVLNGNGPSSVVNKVIPSSPIKDPLALNKVSPTPIKVVPTPIKLISTTTSNNQNGENRAKTLTDSSATKLGIKRPSPMLKSPTPEKAPKLSILPHMPKLTNDENMNSSTTPATPTKEFKKSLTNGTANSPIVRPKMLYGPIPPPSPANSINSMNVSSGSSSTMSNKSISLVPYETYDDETDDSDNDNDDVNMVYKSSSDYLTNGVSVKHTMKNGGYKSSAAIDDLKNGNVKPTFITTNTVVIETKAGRWQVSELIESPPPTTPTKLIHNGGHHQSNKSANQNGQQNRAFTNGGNSNKNGNITSQLLKYGNRGYGMNVQSWNGGTSQIEKEVAEEKREERKRQREDENEHEMDRGRVKKNKQPNGGNQGRDNPGYNAFQEMQAQQNRRWAGNNSHFYSHVYRQTPHRNNFRGGRFRHHNRFNNGHRNNHQKVNNYHR